MSDDRDELDQVIENAKKVKEAYGKLTPIEKARIARMDELDRGAATLLGAACAQLKRSGAVMFDVLDAVETIWKLPVPK